MEVQKNKTLSVIKDPNQSYYYEINEDKLKGVPGTPIAYWLNDKMFEIFDKEKTVDYYAETKSGISPGLTSYFLKHWYEVKKTPKKYLNLGRKEIALSNQKWFACNKGGSYRKWYGNNEYFINWEDDGAEIRKFERSYIRNLDYQFKEHIGYSRITSSDTSFRYYPDGTLFTDSSSGIFTESIEYMLGYFNSKIPLEILSILNPTLNFQAGDIKRIPVIISEKYKIKIEEIVKENIKLSKVDWDSIETSWDFKFHPLSDVNIQVDMLSTLKKSYKNWKESANSNFEQLKENEEKLNEIFIGIYGLEDELTPEVSDKDITITKIFDDKKDIYEDIKGNRYIQTKEDVVKSFISYAVGCMLGRYSLDEEGLIYAGGEWNENRYGAFKPVEDNVLLITDEEYFNDDIVNRFVEFVIVVFGEETLEENLEFIADSLSGRGSPREKIRNYFMNNFYKDHVQTYKKHPIYWMYDSSAGKTKRNSADGFKALVYMHRYDEDTTGKVRMDYLHKVQRAYEQKMDNLEYQKDLTDNAREIADAEKEIEKITKQLKELQDYDEKIGHLALSRIPVDLDDGVRVNYDKVQTDENGKKLKILAKK